MKSVAEMAVRPAQSINKKEKEKQKTKQEPSSGTCFTGSVQLSAVKRKTTRRKEFKGKQKPHRR